MQKIILTELNTHDKASQQTENRRKLSQPDKLTYEKPTVNFILNGGNKAKMSTLTVST